MQIYKLAFWSLAITALVMIALLALEIVCAVLALRLPAPNVFGATDETALPTIVSSLRSRTRRDWGGIPIEQSEIWQRSASAIGGSLKRSTWNENGQCSGCLSIKATEQSTTTYAAHIGFTTNWWRDGGTRSPHQIMMRTSEPAHKSKQSGTQNAKNQY